MNSLEVAGVLAGLPAGFVGVVGGDRWEFFRVVSPGHVARVSVDCDWGGPCDWQAVCSCGWLGSLGTDSSRGPEGSYAGSLAEACVHAGVSLEGERERVAGEVRRLMQGAGDRAASAAGDVAVLLNGEDSDDRSTLLATVRAVEDAAVECRALLQRFAVVEQALLPSPCLS